MIVNIPITKKKQDSVSYVVRYADGSFYVNYKGSKIPINEQQTLITKKTKAVYSLPVNDKHKAWSKRKFAYNDIKDIDIVSRYWSPLFDGQKVNGYVKANIFYIV